MLNSIWDFLGWLEQTGLSRWVREGDFISRPFSTFYVMLGFHAIGMAAVVGICFMLSVRLFGYYRIFPLRYGRTLMTLAWWGFYLNLASGIFLLIAQPRREFLTATFNIKILMIVFACVTMVMMQRAMASIKTIPSAGGGGAVIEVVPESAKTLALLTDLFWLGAIVAGRLIGYVQPPPP
jgi:hypothetical protein